MTRGPKDNNALERRFHRYQQRLDHRCSQNPQDAGKQNASSPPPSSGGSNVNPRGRTQPRLRYIIQLQPETRPMTQQCLVAEVKGIYKRLAMVESKCIEEVNALLKEGAADLNDEQWQALGALHRALLHKHHDFFLASQHPSAGQQLTKLASKYEMPIRMWRYGIHSYLELLRQRLPKSREHMLSHISLAYDMMALLYETVPRHRETWMECLGDLGRYRMAIEDDKIQDRETWTEVSRQWYKRVSDLHPRTGRLYHHLAIVARPNWLQQLLYYSKSLCVPNPFESARESILTLFEPLLLLEPGVHPYEMQQQPIDRPFVRCHACMFMRTGTERQRSFAGIANCCAMVEYGSKSNVILQVIDPESDGESDGLVQDVTSELEEASSAGSSDSAKQPTDEFLQARALMCETARLILIRLGDPVVWPFIHVTLVFVHHLTLYHAKGGMEHLERAFPWAPLIDLLNTLRRGAAGPAHAEDVFPGLAEDGGPPLPEDFTMRGLLWAGRYHPDWWIEEAAVDDEARAFELASMTEQRRDRILWLGRRIAACGRWIACDEESGAFSVAPEFAEDVDDEGDLDVTV